MTEDEKEYLTVTPPVDGEIRVNGGPWTRLPVVAKSGDRVETRARMPDDGQSVGMGSGAHPDERS